LRMMGILDRSGQKGRCAATASASILPRVMGLPARRRLRAAAAGARHSIHSRGCGPRRRAGSHAGAEDHNRAHHPGKGQNPAAARNAQITTACRKITKSFTVPLLNRPARPRGARFFVATRRDPGRLGMPDP
jgi:hypothetical protein